MHMIWAGTKLLFYEGFNACLFLLLIREHSILERSWMRVAVRFPAARARVGIPRGHSRVRYCTWDIGMSTAFGEGVEGTSYIPYIL